jgi:hypothetical protein
MTPRWRVVEESPMNLADELQKLQELHRTGGLSDEEFAAAKAAVLARAPTAPESPAIDTTQQQIEELRRENELARLDREWQMERERYMVTGQNSYRSYVPSRGASIFMGVAIVVGGIIWIIFTASITSNMPGGGFSAFPLFGILFILVGLGISIYNYTRANQYEEAYQRYQRRRNELLSDQHRTEEPQ